MAEKSYSEIDERLLSSYDINILFDIILRLGGRLERASWTKYYRIPIVHYIILLLYTRSTHLMNISHKYMNATNTYIIII